MAATFDRELIRILEEAGCRFIRFGKGSHQIWYSPVGNRNFVVPNGIVSRHTANGVLKDAGLPKKF
jgi:predicted RNA binding protein YcfA (HicA-like mRNA interferase family)